MLPGIYISYKSILSVCVWNELTVYACMAEVSMLAQVWDRGEINQVISLWKLKQNYPFPFKTIPKSERKVNSSSNLIDSLCVILMLSVYGLLRRPGSQARFAKFQSINYRGLFFLQKCRTGLKHPISKNLDLNQKFRVK